MNGAARPPLDGVRILAVSQFGAGPFGTSLLADMGAEIVKVEDPESGGDSARYVPPPFLGDRDSLYFQSFNRGKKSVTLNLRHRGPPGQGRDRMTRSPRLARETEAPEVREHDAVDTELSPPWITILHNCDCHTFEQVVHQLMKAIACSEEKGWELAWQVHNTGKAVVKVGPEAECVRVGGILASIGLIVTVVQS